MIHHHVVVQAPRDIAAAAAPLILQRSDEDFLEAVLEQLRSQEGRNALRADVAAARNADQVLKLFQPVQRQHHIAMIEAWCDIPGTPRLDPAKVDSAGMVLRRHSEDVLSE